MRKTKKQTRRTLSDREPLISSGTLENNLTK